jgi:methionyl aminopeptidase
MMEPGVRTGEIDQAVERLLLAEGAVAVFKGTAGVVPFPAATCISINEQAVHGIPGERELEEGDLVSVDIGCRLDGWCSDAAWTYPVGTIDGEKQRLVATGIEALRLALREMGRECRWTPIARRMQRLVKQAGFSVVDEVAGHGIGRDLHEDPQVPSSVSGRFKRSDFDLVPGLVLAVEPVVNAGGKSLEVSRVDHWTVLTRDRRPSVHFEHTVAVTADGPVVLSERVRL